MRGVSVGGWGGWEVKGGGEGGAEDCSIQDGVTFPFVPLPVSA